MWPMRGKDFSQIGRFEEFVAKECPDFNSRKLAVYRDPIASTPKKKKKAEPVLMFPR